MEQYNLLPNEAVIMRCDHVILDDSRNGDKKSIFASTSLSGELLLTNLNLVFTYTKGTFRQSKELIVFPISKIKVFNNCAQALVAKYAGTNPQLDVYFIDGQETFLFLNKYEAKKWADNINKLVTGRSEQVNTPESFSLSGVAQVADTLKDTFGSLASAFGVKAKNPEIKSSKCIYCGAPISGSEGQNVQCQYCRTNQQI